MKISLNWLKKYVDVSVSDEELIRLIGARLVEVEGVIDETHKYDKIYVVKVESCEKIPDTHLTLCQIDCGNKELIQVVCGAPNVRAGMNAVWIAPGAVVPASVHEDAPFVIGKRKMRGYESNGMLAGADELDFGDDHSGIVEMEPGTAEPGTLLADVFELRDLVLEIENKSLTHRPDTFGIIGFAREVAGILGEEFDEPELHKERGLTESGVKIRIEDADICQRYTALVLEKHGEFSQKYLTWRDTILSKSGMKPVSPIVDVTNYLMLLTGQPLHAFDYDKFVAVGGTKEPEIVVRLAKLGEKLILLDDKQVDLNENDIVICSGKTPVALAGAMGGKSTMIDETTRKVIIESATFSLYNLRKTQMAHGIFSEAVTRFTKGLSPYQTLSVATQCADLLDDGFRLVDGVDLYPNQVEETVVKITTTEINELLGTDYEDGLIVETLENVGFRVKKKRSELTIVSPEWRTDIHIKEDIIEEVGRLLGYDNIRPLLPLHGTASYNKVWELKSRLRRMMSRLGANEVLTYSFVSERLMRRVGQNPDNAYRIVNSISPELQYVRQSIVPSLLEKAQMNQKIPVECFAIYEMNEVYRKEWKMTDEGVPVEKLSLGFVLAERKGTETAYYKAKKYAAAIYRELNIEVQFVPIEKENEETKPFEPKRTVMIMVDGEYAGVVGEFKNSVRNEFKLMPCLAGFEIDMGVLIEKMSARRHVDYRDTEKRDLTVTTTESYESLVRKIEKVLAKYNVEARIEPGTIYQPRGASGRNITVHLEFVGFDEKVMNELEKL